jgi:uncharacterized membrane protein (DUF485 family)
VEDEPHTEAGARTASEVPWSEIARSPDFQQLMSLRRKITLGLLGVFVVAFGAFLVCCAYARPFMRRSVDGGLSVAYVWLLALTVLAWVLVWVYLRLSDGPLGALAERTLEQSAVGVGRERRVADREAEDASERHATGRAPRSVP